MARRKFSPQHVTAFPQAYVVTLNDGRVMLWAGSAPGFERGQEQAEAETRESCRCEVWASCAYPRGDGFAFTDGIHELKGGTHNEIHS